MSARETYQVVARRWEHGWELHIDGIGVTQSRSLGEAERMVRHYVALDGEIPEDSFDVEIMPEIDGGLDEETRSAREAVRAADEMQRQAAKRSREVARRLRDTGLSGRDIAAVLGVSAQRVSQLLAPRDKVSC